MRGLSLLKADYIDRDLYRRNRSSVLKPVCGVPILGPTHSRPIVRSDSSSMVSDRSLQYVDDAWSVVMVVHRAEDATRLDGHHTHSKLAPRHALDLRAKVNRCKYLRRNTVRLRCRLFVAHRALLSVLPGPHVRLPTPSTKARQWWGPCRPRVSTGVAPGRVHCGAGRLVGPQVATPSASERQYQQIGEPCPPTGESA